MLTFTSSANFDIWLYHYGYSTSKAWSDGKAGNIWKGTQLVGTYEWKFDVCTVTMLGG